MEQEKEELKASTGLKVLCFFIPLVGLIIYASNISHNRNYARQCGIASLWGFLTPIIIGICIGIIMLGAGIFGTVNSNQQEKLQQ